MIDFHSLRPTFITGLAERGVHPRVAQALARHSDMRLTMKTYTDLHLLDLQGAVETLAPKGANVLAPMLAPKPVSTAQNVSSSFTTPDDEVGERAGLQSPDGCRSEPMHGGVKGGGRSRT